MTRIWLCLVAFTTLFASCVMPAGTTYSTTPVATGGVEEPYEPPPPPIAESPRPRRGQVWVPGHYEWLAGRYVWQPGHYERQRTGYRYVPGFWDAQGSRHIWVPGRWEEEQGYADNDPNYRPYPPPQPDYRPPPPARAPDYRTRPRPRAEAPDPYQAPAPPPPLSEYDENGDYPTEAPPEPRIEQIPSRPGYIWAAGHYEWRGRRYVWVAGRWEQERPNMVWIPGRWERRGRHYLWLPGYWVKAR